MELTIYNKVIQSLILSNKEDSIVLAHLLVKEKKTILAWGWINNRMLQPHERKWKSHSLTNLGLPQAIKVLEAPNIIARKFYNFFNESAKEDDLQDYLERYKQRHDLC